ncbi:hypothetical protein P170DRAFT_430475 [Aspergillus steynii IBT 23096]|uniref:Uncharacterized protein n=1 Tax=Aspergillus steynii IBT 23096 TaxID=1392250 RepID=A0A2I2FVG5_9EURO|nr:uncharacterized protein P170DRAFT_430475 [Aspergillus steynii IBT 23096]PLB44601.1 hypothetical protein P170DRAFT_430475 [Aspergillus steynii IBT 23096]
MYETWFCVWPVQGSVGPLDMHRYTGELDISCPVRSNNFYRTAYRVCSWNGTPRPDQTWIRPSVSSLVYGVFNPQIAWSIIQSPRQWKKDPNCGKSLRVCPLKVDNRNPIMFRERQVMENGTSPPPVQEKRVVLCIYSVRSARPGHPDMRPPVNPSDAVERAKPRIQTLLVDHAGTPYMDLRRLHQIAYCGWAEGRG